MREHEKKKPQRLQPAGVKRTSILQDHGLSRDLQAVFDVFRQRTSHVSEKGWCEMHNSKGRATGESVKQREPLPGRKRELVKIAHFFRRY